MHVNETIFRTRKAQKIAAWIRTQPIFFEAFKKDPNPFDTSEEVRNAVALEAGVDFPSEHTWAVVCVLLEEYDHARE